MEFLTGLVFPVFALFAWYTVGVFFIKIAGGYSPHLEDRYQHKRLQAGSENLSAHQ